ncbi:iron complex transport system permease protein [Microbacterium terrae]|uniref:Hemin transport system permease protein HmuU n=1 Tax=Microbacterium terrae TaxID=69369 RepID=A0A0M2HC77_9MICO|nr:iron ABC transporter permease [Microbacterium terrae]KJL44204.1 Hemin transport system permease protein HmuU [Microbacterium terrae]MBP1078744.1 iron complex transport system permease protein [Microbacterium terrae]GLJ98145.1 ABC transporter permease [Microbacterium terrae]
MTAEVVTAVPTEHRGIRFALLVGALAVTLVVVVVLSLGLGQYRLAPSEVVGVLLQSVGLDTAWAPAAPTAAGVVLDIRLPRIVLGLLVGAALAVSGVLMQAIFGNPLADAAVVGVSSGAALGAATSLTFGLAVFGMWTTPGFAFIGGLVAVFAVYLISRSGGRTEVVTLLLTGIAVNAIAGAGLAFLTFLGTTATREQIVFWQLGSLNGALWSNIALVAPLIAVGVAIGIAVAGRLDLFALGERTARHLGVRVELLRVVVIVTVALLVCGAVAFAGIIGFVGLVVPHLMRMAIGPAHLPLVIASALGGSLLIVAADLIARTAVPLADLPIGMITSLVGGPFFLWLLLRTRRRAGGWG